MAAQNVAHHSSLCSSPCTLIPEPMYCKYSLELLLDRPDFRRKWSKLPPYSMLPRLSYLHTTYSTWSASFLSPFTSPYVGTADWPHFLSKGVVYSQLCSIGPQIRKYLLRKGSCLRGCYWQGKYIKISVVPSGERCTKSYTIAYAQRCSKGGVTIRS